MTIVSLASRKRASPGRSRGCISDVVHMFCTLSLDYRQGTMSRYPKLTINQSSSKQINPVNAALPAGYKAASVHQLLQGA